MSNLKRLRVLEELRVAGAAEQARAMVRGHIDASAMLAAEATAIDEQNPRLNAFVQTLLPEPSVKKPPCQSLPLCGTTFAVKDNFDVTGLATHAGLLARNALPAERDATAVSRLKQAGLVLTGKTNMSPMALGASTHNDDFGDCYNPWRDGYSAGGSSGGSASAVAAGLVGIALGTDTMGSVRIPAAFCGIVGFKPSWGQIPVDGLVPLCRSLDHIGVLSRTVEDASLVFSILRNNRTAKEKLNGSISDTGAIGILEDSPALSLQPHVALSYKNACNLLKAQGYNLIPVKLGDISLTRVRRAGLLLCEAELLSTLESVYPEHKQRLPRELVGLLDYIQAQTAQKLGLANTSLAEARCFFKEWFDTVDTVLLPTSAQTAFPMNAPVPADVADLTVIANVLGAPAISLPLLSAKANKDDLPVGVQLMGRYGEDDGLLLLADKLSAILS